MRPDGSQIEVTWRGYGRKATQPANPAFPQGIAVEAPRGALVTCLAKLRYPAPECGVWVLHCPVCDFRMIVTAAGRTDDPVSVKVPCNMAGKA